MQQDPSEQEKRKYESYVITVGSYNPEDYEDVNYKEYSKFIVEFERKYANTKYMQDRKAKEFRGGPNRWGWGGKRKRTKRKRTKRRKSRK
jgi:hypothetical protein